ncbi:MAG: glycosyltransferase family 2 protein [Pseudomonadota bacterium]|nr:glycosyltransferase family 2 protein [Pseudomonadota bacterium]
MPLASVIVTYNPPAGLAERVAAALAQTDFVVVIDNGSDQHPDLDDVSARYPDRIQVISRASNIGLAAALNQGIAQCARLGATQALLLDHDSTPSPQMVDTLRKAESSLGPDARVAVLVPAIQYAHPNNRCRWPSSSGHSGPFFQLLYADQLRAPKPVDLAIGSGMLINIAAWEQLGRFDEALFVDLVDTEYCLRARQHGYQIIAVPGAALQHALGHASEQRLLGAKVFPTHHSAMRHYYISRNRVLLARRYARRFPGWMAYELLSGLKLLIKVVLFEDARIDKLRHMVHGTMDGLRGRSGPIRNGA